MPDLNTRLHLVDQNVRNILLIRLDEIGDVIMTTPLIRELRNNFPSANISLLVKPETANIVRTCPYVNDLRIFNWNTSMSGLKSKLYSFFRLRGRYDLVLLPRFDADHYHSAALSRLTQAQWRISYSQNVSERKKKLNPNFDESFTHLIDASSAIHEVGRNLEFLTFLGGTIKSDQLELWLNQEDELYAERILGEFTSSWIALGIGAGSRKRIWPIENFIQFSRQIQKNGPVQFVIVGGQAERASAEELQTKVEGKVISITGKATLRETAAVLKRCQLFVGNDAGPMHIAAAVGTPVVEISCHPLNGSDEHYNSPRRFGPWGVPSVILQPKTGLDLCIEGCDLTEPHCIRSVDVLSVVEAASESLHLGKQKNPGD